MEKVNHLNKRAMPSYFSIKISIELELHLKYITLSDKAYRGTAKSDELRYILPSLSSMKTLVLIPMFPHEFNNCSTVIFISPFLISIFSISYFSLYISSIELHLLCFLYTI